MLVIKHELLIYIIKITAYDKIWKTSLYIYHCFYGDTVNDVIMCTCNEWMGIEQRPQALRWHSESTIPALPNTINLFSSSSWETVNSTRDMPDAETNNTQTCHKLYFS